MDSIPHSKPALSSVEFDALRETLLSGQISLGPASCEFERQVGRFIGTRHAVAVSSGTAALIGALRALDVGASDEVILPTYVCRDVMDAVSFCGATPVLCDIGEEWSVTRAAIKPHLTRRTKAVIVPYLFGIPIDLDPILDLGLPVLEDIAQAFGTENGKGAKAGSKGLLNICSFHATKCLTTGEGGMVLCNDKKYLERLRVFQGLFPLSDLNASLGISQLKQFPSFLAKRRTIADCYFRRLDPLGPICLPGHLREGSSFFRFVIKLPAPFKVVAGWFESRSITVRRGVDNLLHRILKLPRKKFPVAEALFAQTISLPIYPALSQENIHRVADAAAALAMRVMTQP